MVEGPRAAGCSPCSLYWLLGMGIPFALSLVWGLVSAFQKSGADTSAMFAAVDVIVQVVLYLVQLVISGVFSLGLWAMAVRGLHGQRTTVGALFSQLSKIGKYILQALAVSVGAVLVILPIVVIVWLVFVGPVDLDTPMSEIIDDAGKPFAFATLVLLPLYLYIVSGIAFMQAELAFNDDAGPSTPIIHSWRIARGKRWRIIGVGLLAHAHREGLGDALWHRPSVRRTPGDSALRRALPGAPQRRRRASGKHGTTLGRSSAWHGACILSNG